MPVPPHFDGINRVTSDSNTMTITSGGGAPAASSIVVGEYYLASHTGSAGDTDQLIERLITAIDAVHGVGNVSVAVERGYPIADADDIGKITITNDDPANALTIAWTDTDLRDLLGFTGADTGAIAAAGGTVTGANQVRNSWWPSVPPVEYTGPIGVRGARTSPDATLTIAPDGTTVGRSYSELTKRRLVFLFVPQREVWPVQSDLVSYDDWWERIVKDGYSFRYYAERNDLDGSSITGAPHVYVMEQDTQRKGSSLWTPTVKRREDIYSATLEMARYV